MIIKSTENTPITAPQFNDMNAALDVYRTFKNDQALSMNTFYKFITRSSNERDEFLQLFNPTVIIRNNLYVKVNYN